MPKKQTLDFTIHRYFGVHFNQKIWDYLEKESISKEEAYEMIDIAHASNHHWRFAGTIVNQQRGAYMIARVYLAAGSTDAAILYAKRCMDLTENNKEEMKDFDLAYAYEMLAKCELAEGNTDKGNELLNEAKRLGSLITGKGDKEYFEKDLSTTYKNLMK